MQIGNVQWKWNYPGALLEDIQEFENRWNLKLPAAYISIVRFSEAAVPQPQSIVIPGIYQTCVGCMIPICEHRRIGEPNVSIVSSSVSDRLPVRVLPFANEVGGDLFCFDFRVMLEPRICYWYMEGAWRLYQVEHSPEEKELADSLADGRSLFWLADTFEDFLKLLFEEPMPDFLESD